MSKDKDKARYESLAVLPPSRQRSISLSGGNAERQRRSVSPSPELNTRSPRAPQNPNNSSNNVAGAVSGAQVDNSANNLRNSSEDSGNGSLSTSPRKLTASAPQVMMATPLPSPNGATPPAPFGFLPPPGDNVEIQGVLWKRALLGNWKKRSFKISSGMLLYSNAKGGFRSVPLSECAIKKAEGLANRPYSFVLFIGDKKTFLLAADSEEQKNKWMEGLKAHSTPDLGKMKLLHLLEGMHECVVVSDEKGAILGFNRAAKQMFGYHYHEVMGKNVDILMPSPYKDLHQSFITKHIMTGDSQLMGVTRRVLGQRSDGTVFPLELGLGRINTHDGRIRFIATMREVATHSTAETLTLVESAQSNIQANLSALQSSVESEFGKLKQRIMDLEHEKRDLDKMLEGMRKKVEYHMKWREAAEKVMRDAQRKEIQKLLGGLDESTDFDIDDFQLQTAMLIYPEMVKELRSWLPAPQQIKKPTLLFSTIVHGCLLSTFLSRCNVAPTLMLIRTMETNHIFGAYCSDPWTVSERYYGDGQCFLFTLLPRAKKFEWKPAHPTYFMMATDKSLIVGGGEGYGLWIDDMLENGMSAHCETFDNDPLAPNERFKIAVLEVYGFY